MKLHSKGKYYLLYLIRNLILTITVTLTTAFIGVCYNKIENIISFLGGFCSIIVSYFFPTFIYIVSNDIPVKSLKGILPILIFGTLSIIGIVSGTLSFVAFVSGNQ